MSTSPPDESARISKLFTQRESQCRIERRALEMWLGLLTPLKWFTVGGGTVLSALAGATVLGKPEFLGERWPLIGGVCALVSSILTGLHTALKCDSHQAECHRLIRLYSSLEASYQAAQVLPASQFGVKMQELEARFEEATIKSTASPPRYFRQPAEKGVKESSNVA